MKFVQGERRHQPRLEARGRDLNESSLLFGTLNEIERSQIMVFLRRRRVFIRDDFRQESGRFGRTGAPNKVTARWGVPMVADGGQPGTEEPVFLVVRADAERFEVPAILP